MGNEMKINCEKGEEDMSSKEENTYFKKEIIRIIENCEDNKWLRKIWTIARLHEQKKLAYSN